MEENMNEDSTRTDDKLCGGEPMVTEVKGEDVGREVTVQTGGNSPGSALLLDTQSQELEPASEWDTYVDSQIRSDWKDMPFEERAFCDEYLENGYKHRLAAESAGYALSAGIRLINKPLLREYIHWAEAKKRSRTLVSEHFFDAQLAELYDQAIGEVEVACVTGQGDKFDALKFDGRLALSIIQERAKISGVSKPEIAEGTGGVTVVIDVGALLGKEKPTKVVSEQ